MAQNNEMIRAFRHWLWSYGDTRRFKYYEGNLAQDRWINWQLEKPEVNHDVDALAKEVMDEYMEGHILLTQERLGDGKFAYWAMKTERML